MNNNNIAPNWQRDESQQKYKPEYSETFKRAKWIFNKGRQVHYQGNIHNLLFPYNLITRKKYKSFSISSNDI